MPEETVYNLVKTMMENADALEAVHKNAAGTCPERGIEGALIPMHPAPSAITKRSACWTDPQFPFKFPPD